VRRTLAPWLLVAPLATLGVLGGHQLAYAVTGTRGGELHSYLGHAPQAALLLTLLSLGGASFVERGGRLALWPFPAVAVLGFVVQEHVERLSHTGSIPFLLDKPFFLVGLAVQAAVALAAWLVARLLVRVAGRPVPERPRATSCRPPCPRRPLSFALAGAALGGSLGARSPPLVR
jgi:hypothetical protein